MNKICLDFSQCLRREEGKLGHKERVSVERPDSAPEAVQGPSLTNRGQEYAIRRRCTTGLK